jgi:effector-binding domain-containing protein
VQIRELRPVHTAAVRRTVAEEAVPTTLGRIFDRVLGTLESQGVAPIGPPFAWYHAQGERVDLEAGFPVETDIRPEGEVRPSTLPAGPTLVAVHVGPFDTLSDTYRLVEERMAELGCLPRDGPIECYLTDAETTAPAGWRTELRQPVLTGAPIDRHDAAVS